MPFVFFDMYQPNFDSWPRIRVPWRNFCVVLVPSRICVTVLQNRPLPVPSQFLYFEYVEKLSVESVCYKSFSWTEVMNSTVRCPIRISSAILGLMTRVICGSFLSLRVNTVIVPQVRWSLLPSKFFLTNYSLIIPPFQDEFLTEQLNNLTYLTRSSFTLLFRVLFFILIILQTVGFHGRVISSSQDLYLNTGQHKHGLNT
jgi:hypothetical protein